MNTDGLSAFQLVLDFRYFLIGIFLGNKKPSHYINISNWVGLLIKRCGFTNLGNAHQEDDYVRYPCQIIQQFRLKDLLSLLYFFLLQTWVESN